MSLPQLGNVECRTKACLTHDRSSAFFAGLLQAPLDPPTLPVLVRRAPPDLPVSLSPQENPLDRSLKHENTHLRRPYKARFRAASPTLSHQQHRTGVFFFFFFFLSSERCSMRAYFLGARCGGGRNAARAERMVPFALHAFVGSFLSLFCFASSTGWDFRAMLCGVTRSVTPPGGCFFGASAPCSVFLFPLFPVDLAKKPFRSILLETFPVDLATKTFPSILLEKEW